MQKARCLLASGMLLLFGAASPAFAQVTMLNGDDALNPPNPPVDVTNSVPTVSPSTNGAPNSLIVTGPVDKGETAPSIPIRRSTSGKSFGRMRSVAWGCFWPCLVFTWASHSEKQTNRPADDAGQHAPARRAPARPPVTWLQIILLNRATGRWCDKSQLDR